MHVVISITYKVDKKQKLIKNCTNNNSEEIMKEKHVPRIGDRVDRRESCPILFAPNIRFRPAYYY